MVLNMYITNSMRYLLAITIDSFASAYECVDSYHFPYSIHNTHVSNV